MNPWSLSAHFANWLKNQKDTTITPDLANTVEVSALDMGSLICVMYYGDGHQALAALKRLRDCFDDELFQQGEQA